MDYYKVVDKHGYILLVTPIKMVAQDIVKQYACLNYKIEIVKGDIYLLHNL